MIKTLKYFQYFDQSTCFHSGHIDQGPKERRLGVTGRDQSGGGRNPGVSEWAPREYHRLNSID